MTLRTEFAMLSCVHGTIFGVPVVPPVNMIRASSGLRSSGADAGGFGSTDVSKPTRASPAATVIGQDGKVASPVPAGSGSPTRTTRAPAA
jgi:hypothetical protein